MLISLFIRKYSYLENLNKIADCKREKLENKYVILYFLYKK